MNNAITEIKSTLEGTNSKITKAEVSIMEMEMATHSCVLAWRIPGNGEPGGLLSTGSHRVGHG